jgi:hypothetical protein
MSVLIQERFETAEAGRPLLCLFIHVIYIMLNLSFDSLFDHVLAGGGGGGPGGGGGELMHQQKVSASVTDCMLPWGIACKCQRL